MKSTQFYNIYDLLQLRLRDEVPVPELHRALAHLTTEPQGQEFTQLRLRGLRRTAGPWTVRLDGRYKGIPWQIGWGGDGSGPPEKVEFNSPFFHTFLGVRLALIPLVRQVVIDRGGFALLGTAFRWRGTTWHLYGRPGAGKTKLLLEALQDGAELIGDFELLVLPDGTIRPLFDQVEFRYGTIRHTPYWQRLTSSQRWWLRGCRAISFVTGRRISFNLAIPPSEVGWAVAADEAVARHVLVALGGAPGDWDTESAVSELVAYYRWYESIYPVTFCLDRDLRDRRLAENMRRHFRRCELVTLASDPSLDQLPWTESSR